MNQVKVDPELVLLPTILQKNIDHDDITNLS